MLCKLVAELVGQTGEYSRRDTPLGVSRYVQRELFHSKNAKERETVFMPSFLYIIKKIKENIDNSTKVWYNTVSICRIMPFCKNLALPLLNIVKGGD